MEKPKVILVPRVLYFADGNLERIFVILPVECIGIMKKESFMDSKVNVKSKNFMSLENYDL